GDDKAERTEGTAALQVFPALSLSRDNYARFPFLCPASTFLQSLHRARDQRLVADWSVDGVYYDISLNNVRHTCISSAHQHQPGASTAITDAYREMLSKSAAAMKRAADGTAIPQGSELINEQLVSHLAFYQARAEASPAAPFEADPFRTMIKNRSAEKIPLFTYVYHEFGPVRIDGWAKLSREQGDFVYFVLGRVFVQGGLIELNYEFSALEDLGTPHDQPAEHYYPFPEHYFAIDPELAAYVGSLALARIGRANRYLAYGVMLRPAPFEVLDESDVELEYYLYHVGTDFSEYGERGSMTVPAVLQSTWRYRDESVAWIFLNVAPEDRRIYVHIDLPTLANGSPRTWQLTCYQEDDLAGPMGRLTAPRRVRLDLPARRPVLLEAVPIQT
ncbi:MAG: hypothetical protein JWO59_1983, partial [Chloroflexi bacterium]|nr:hypothetical protein [Chloroflexota bacterium]